MATLYPRIQVAWFNLIHNKLRLLGSVAGVAFAVILMFVEIGFLYGVYDSQTLVVEKMNADLIIISRHKHAIVPKRPFPRARLAQALGFKGVEEAYALYVEERAGLFVGGEEKEPGEEGIETLRFAVKAAQRQGFELIPVWTVSYNAAEAIARAAEVLEVDTVVMGVSRRSAIYHLLRGHVVNGLTRRLPASCHLLLYN